MQFGEIGSVYPSFAIMTAIGLLKPYTKPEAGANLVLYDVYWIDWCCYGLLMNRIEIPGIIFQYQNNAQYANNQQ